jgi:hypothetical protein
MKAALDPCATRVPTANGTEFAYLRARQGPSRPHKGERPFAKRSYARRFRRTLRRALREAERN